MNKIIIFNGPKGCGKDTAAAILENYLGDNDVTHMKLSQSLKDIVANQLNIPVWKLEADKRVRTEYRDLQIAVYESLSRVFGRDWLGVNLTNRIIAQENDNIVVSDGGRDEEIDRIIRNFGARNVMICQIIRNGCTFDYDIRGYISDARVTMAHVTNDDLDSFRTKIIDIGTEFFAGE